MPGAKGEVGEGLGRGRGETRRVSIIECVLCLGGRGPNLLDPDSRCLAWVWKAAEPLAVCPRAISLKCVAFLKYMGHITIATTRGVWGGWDLLRSPHRVKAWVGPEGGPRLLSSSISL